MGSDWGLPYSKENKTFFLQKLYQKFTKFSKFFLAPSIPPGDGNTTMPFSTKRKKIYGVGRGVEQGGWIGGQTGGSNRRVKRGVRLGGGSDEVVGKFFLNLTSFS